jgi:tartrate dehydratase beta subunit/fumarate hydratase class I family protein
MEYVIEITRPAATEYVSLSGKIVNTTRDMTYASKFKVKARAETIARRLQNATVAPYFGGIVTSNKSNVTGPQADRIRRN